MRLDILAPSLLMLAATLAPQVAEARPLTLRRADRAIDLALQAELAGDIPGARRALTALVRSSTTPISTAGRARVRRWLHGLDRRESVWKGETDKARLYSAVMESLAPFGLARVEMVWDAALVEVPRLKAIRERQARVAVLPDRIVGLDHEMSEALRKQLTRTLGRNGLRVEWPDVMPVLPRRHQKSRTPQPIGTYWFKEGETAPFEVRLEVDATGRRVSGPRVEVEARATYILKAPGPDGIQLGRFARRRRETRRSELAARRFAVRQMGTELAEAVVVQIWLQCLRQAAESLPPAAFDSGADVGSN